MTWAKVAFYVVCILDNTTLGSRLMAILKSCHLLHLRIKRREYWVMFPASKYFACVAISAFATNLVFLHGHTIVSVPNNVTRIAIKSCPSTVPYVLGIFNVRMTWFQAQQACIGDGYESVDHAERNWVRRNHMRDYLRAENVATGSYWTDLYRPSTSSTTWFSCTAAPCREFVASAISALSQSDELCSVAFFNMSERLSSTVKLLPANCFNKYYYACKTTKGGHDYRVYENFDLYVLPYYMYVDNHSALSLDDCIAQCNGRVRCGALVYNNITYNCTLLVNDMGYAISEFEIVSGTDNTTFANKYRCEVTAHNTSNLNVSNIDDTFSFTLPPCTSSTTSSSPTTGSSNFTNKMCSCSTTALSQEEFNDLIANLTVSKVTTSKHKRKKSSAEDNRPQAKTIGALGLVITILILCLPIVSDFLTFMQRYSKIRNLWRQQRSYRKWQTVLKM